MVLDSNKTRSLNIDELSDALTENNVHISNQELDLLFQEVTENGRTVNYLKLISDCRGQMTLERENLVNALFSRIDAHQREEVNADDLLERFRPEMFEAEAGQHTSAEYVADDFSKKLDLFGRLGVSSKLNKGI